MKVYVIYKSEGAGYDGSVTTIIEVHTDINAAKKRVDELDKKDRKAYYDFEEFDLIDKN